MAFAGMVVCTSAMNWNFFQVNSFDKVALLYLRVR
jgi:hypothetical protein